MKQARILAASPIGQFRRNYLAKIDGAVEGAATIELLGAHTDMILFLDFDGVLHPAICTSPSDLLCCRSVLESVLRECAHVEIVISSTWRESRTLVELRRLFSPDIAARVIGVTPQWQDLQDEATMGTYVRQAEIEAWLRQAGRPWESWVALDDQPWLFRPFLQNLVRSDPDTGLTEGVCTLLRKRLQSA